jgi:hypothetical protein
MTSPFDWSKLFIFAQSCLLALQKDDITGIRRGGRDVQPKLDYALLLEPMLGRMRQCFMPTRTHLLPTTVAFSKKSSPSQQNEGLQLSWTEKGKLFLREYGKVGIVTHITLSVLSYSILYMSITKGLDVGAYIQSWSSSVQADHSNSTENGIQTASNFVVTYALYKMLTPIRWPLTFFVTPIVVKQLKKRERSKQKK